MKKETNVWRIGGFFVQLRHNFSTTYRPFYAKLVLCPYLVDQNGVWIVFRLMQPNVTKNHLDCLYTDDPLEYFEAENYVRLW